MSKISDITKRLNESNEALLKAIEENNQKFTKELEKALNQQSQENLTTIKLATESTERIIRSDHQILRSLATEETRKTAELLKQSEESNRKAIELLQSNKLKWFLILKILFLSIVIGGMWMKITVSYWEIEDQKQQIQQNYKIIQAQTQAIKKEQQKRP